MAVSSDVNLIDFELGQICHRLCRCRIFSNLKECGSICKGLVVRKSSLLPWLKKGHGDSVCIAVSVTYTVLRSRGRNVKYSDFSRKRSGRRRDGPSIP